MCQSQTSPWHFEAWLVALFYHIMWALFLGKNNTVKQIFSDGAADDGKQIYLSCKQSNLWASLISGKETIFPLSL